MQSNHDSVIDFVSLLEHSDHAFSWALENFLSPDKDLAVLVNVRPEATVPGPFGTAYTDFTGTV